MMSVEDNAATNEPMSVDPATTVPNSSSSPISIADTENLNKSALQDNIERKGKNAYYFAHAHKATGPKWDGKIEPRLLARESSSNLGGSGVKNSGVGSKVASFEYHKSNITNYAFLDEGDESRKVKIYVELPGVGSCCPKDEDVALEFTERSLCLTVLNYVAPASPVEVTGDGDEVLNGETEKKGVDRCLSFGKLFGEIESASFRKKADKIIITLKKKDEEKWSSIIAS